MDFLKEILMMDEWTEWNNETEKAVFEELLDRKIVHEEVIGRYTLREVESPQNSETFMLLNTKTQEPLCFLDTTIVRLFGNKYNEVSLVYCRKSERKSSALGMMIFGLKKFLKNQLILGSPHPEKQRTSKFKGSLDTFKSGLAKGGILFPGGAELVKAVGGSKNFSVHTFNLETGEIGIIKDYSPEAIKNLDIDLTLMFDFKNK